MPRDVHHRTVLFTGGNPAVLPMSRRFVFRRLHESGILHVRHRTPGDVEFRDIDAVLRLFVTLSVLIFRRIAAHEKFTGGDKDQFEMDGGGDGQNIRPGCRHPDFDRRCGSRRWLDDRRLGKSTQYTGSRSRNPAAVVVDQSRQGLVRRERQPLVATMQQPFQFAHHALAQPGKGTLNGSLQLGRQFGWLHDRARVAGDNNLALYLWRRHLGRLPGETAGEDLLVDVIVQFLERNLAVSVKVGRAGLEALHEEAGKHGRRGLAQQLVTLPGVLDGVAGSQDHPAKAATVLQSAFYPPPPAAAQRTPAARRPSRAALPP